MAEKLHRVLRAEMLFFFFFVINILVYAKSMYFSVCIFISLTLTACSP